MKKLKGAHVPSKSFQLVEPRTQMQTLTMTDMVVIENYYNIMHYGWKHELDETNTYDIVKFSSRP